MKHGHDMMEFGYVKQSFRCQLLLLSICTQTVQCVVVQDLPDTPERLESDIKVLNGWLQTAQHLLALKGLPAAASAAPHISESSMGKPGEAFHERGTKPKAALHPGSNMELGQKPADASACMALGAEIGTDRSLGGIDDALLAQGFRWDMHAECCKRSSDYPALLLQLHQEYLQGFRIYVVLVQTSLTRCRV